MTNQSHGNAPFYYHEVARRDRRSWSSARPLLLKLLALSVWTLFAAASGTVVSAQSCPNIPNGGGESMQAWITVKNTGAPVADGAVLPAGTELRLDSIATANGSCRGRAMGQSMECVDTGFTYERTVNHTDVWADISTATALNGTYTVGYVNGKNPDGSSADWHVLDTTAANSSGPSYSTLSYPGVYQYHFRAIINTTPCNMTPDRTDTVTITIYAGDNNVNNGPDSCKAEVGKPVNVTNGNMYVRQTDYSLPGVGDGLRITRTYNSQGQNKRTGLFGYGWSTELDESITTYGSLGLSVSMPDGRAVFFARASASEPYASKAAPDYRAQIVVNADNSYALTFKDGRVHRFSPAGKLTALVDRNGNQTTLTYDANGKPTAVTDAFGRVLTLTYGGNGLVGSIGDAAGTAATYEYWIFGVLRSVTYPDGSKFVFAETIIGNAFFLTTVKDALDNVLESHTYDTQGRAITSERQGGVEHYTLAYVGTGETDVTDALGHVTKYFFDKSRGRSAVTRVEGSCSCGGSQVQTWTYDSQLNVASKTNALNQTTSYTYDAQGNMLTATDALGTTAYTYNQFGEVLTATDPMNGVTTNTYDALGNLLTTKDALNNTTSFAYDGRGQLTSVTDARNKTTGLTWDTSGRLTQVRDANNNATNYAYDARARVTSVTDAANRTISYEYDLAGRLKKITQPDLSFVTFTYDLAGRKTRVTDARNNSTNYAYDSAYRLAGETNAANQTTSYGYNLMSRPTSRTDALGRVTNYEYDDFNRLVKTIYPPATTGATRLQETIAYDAAGNVTGRTDTAGRTTGYQYDAANRLIRFTDTASQATQYEYNARSNVTAVVDALNQRYTFAYDALGRVKGATRGGVSMSYAYDADGNRTQRTDYNGAVTSYTYDNLNRLTQIAYPDTTTAAYAYDAISRLTTATNQNGAVTIAYDNRNRVQSVTDVFGRAISYGYDANGNRTSMSLGTLAGTSYTYDALNRPTQLTDNTGANVTYGYDATDKLTSRTLPNGVVTSYSYDGLDRLTRLQHVKGAATVADYQYQFNSANQITQVTEPASARSYAYDAVDRVTAMTSPGAPGEAYAYDGVGNRTSSHLSASYGYQGFNRLTTTAAAAYSYDANGNLISKTDAGGTWLCTWDYENRLKSAQRPDGLTVTYKYDAMGRRIQRAPSGGVTTNFTYDRTDVVLDANSDGSTVTYLNGLGVDDKLRQTSSAGGALYFVQDHLGSTRALTDAGGSGVETEQYDSFGGGAGSALTRYGYTGRERDADTGLYNYRARWYDPQAGRFLSEDPIGFAGRDINLYAYVGNNPLSFNDPSGKQRADRDRPGDQYPGMPKPWYPPTESHDGGIGCALDGINPWVNLEGDAGFQFLNFIGGSAGIGVRLNIFTGELCVYTKVGVSPAVAIGLYAGAGPQLGISLGPTQGRKTEGPGGELFIDEAEGLGIGGNAGYGGGLNGALGIKGNVGAGWAFGLRWYKTKILFCINTTKCPCQN